MNDVLTKYILDSKSTGKSDSEIRQILISNGWSQAQVDIAFQATNSNLPTTEQTPPVVASQPATPRKSRKMIFIVLLGFLALVVLVVGGYYLLVEKKILSTTQTSINNQEAPQDSVPNGKAASPTDSADAFLKALQNDDKTEAMKWSAIMTTDQDWQAGEFLRKPFLGNSKYTLNGIGASYGANNYVSLDGTVTASDGSVKNFTMDLEKIDNLWVVTKLGYKISL